MGDFVIVVVVTCREYYRRLFLCVVAERVRLFNIKGRALGPAAGWRRHIIFFIGIGIGTPKFVHIIGQNLGGEVAEIVIEYEIWGQAWACGRVSCHNLVVIAIEPFKI